WPLSWFGTGDRRPQADYRAENPAGPLCQPADAAAWQCANPAVPDPLVATGPGIDDLLRGYRQFQTLQRYLRLWARRRGSAVSRPMPERPDRPQPRLRRAHWRR